ncbi:sensor histidine kinase, partial [Acinetobacter baumannii]
MRTMFNNVIDNAIRYCPTGCTIRAAIETSPTQVMVRIRDDGPGVAPEEISRLTDRFYRVPGTQTEGSGLGLAIVREIAQRHGAS